MDGAEGGGGGGLGMENPGKPPGWNNYMSCTTLDQPLALPPEENPLGFCQHVMQGSESDLRKARITNDAAGSSSKEQRVSEGCLWSHKGVELETGG